LGARSQIKDIMTHASAERLFKENENISPRKPPQRSMSPSSHHVNMYGLRVRSDIDLPGWPRITSDVADVVIRKDPFDAATFDAEQYWTRTLFEEGEVRLEIRGVAKFAACGGTLIRVAPEPGAKPEDVQVFLTGALLGAVLHQRGIFPLHASCVEIDGYGVAFAGHSGEGKSTLVASVVHRGAKFVSDDLCVMTPVTNGNAYVWPGAARVKLDETGLALLNGARTGLDPVGGPRGKYLLPIHAPSEFESPVPLKRVYQLVSADGPPRIERLAGLDAISALVDETSCITYAAGLRLGSQVFRLAAELSRTLVVSRLIRPRGLEHMPAVLDLIERDVREG
jgi:hypothetical protein